MEYNVKEVIAVNYSPSLKEISDMKLFRDQKEASEYYESFLASDKMMHVFKLDGTILAVSEWKDRLVFTDTNNKVSLEDIHDLLAKLANHCLHTWHRGYEQLKLPWFQKLCVRLGIKKFDVTPPSFDCHSMTIEELVDLQFNPDRYKHLYEY